MHLPVIHEQLSQMLLFLLVQRLIGKSAEVVYHLLEVHADEVHRCCWLKSLHFAHNNRAIVLLHLTVCDLVVNLLGLLCLSQVLLELLLMMILLIVLDGNHDLKLLIAGD